MKEITLERLPATVEELAAMPQAALTVPEEVAALTVAALARFLKGTKTVKWDR